MHYGSRQPDFCSSVCAGHVSVAARSAGRRVRERFRSATTVSLGRVDCPIPYGEK
jgi:hypothetical protein